MTQATCLLFNYLGKNERNIGGNLHSSLTWKSTFERNQSWQYSDIAPFLF